MAVGMIPGATMEALGDTAIHPGDVRVGASAGAGAASMQVIIILGITAVAGMIPGIMVAAGAATTEAIGAAATTVAVIMPIPTAGITIRPHIILTDVLPIHGIMQPGALRAVVRM